MCFFRKKTKSIDPNLNISSKELIVNYRLKKGRLYLGTKIKIPRNFAFIICSNNKAIDVLYEGETVIDIKNIPTATRRFSLYKVNKKGKGPKYFEAEVYFVNLHEFEDFKWETAEYAELEDKNYGEYKTSCFGDLSFKISDPIKFLDFVFNKTNVNILLPNQVEKALIHYIDERIVRILNKANPTARNLYLKNKDIIKLIYEKLSELLIEIGIDLFKISLTETRFPPKILADLKNITEQPVDFRGWGKNTFEDWQAENPSAEIKPTEKKPKFVTITPTGNNCPFFKESMAPYFFDEENKEENEVAENEKIATEPIWKGVDEKIIEEQSKQLVDLDNIDDNK